MERNVEQPTEDMKFQMISIALCLQVCGERAFFIQTGGTTPKQKLYKEVHQRMAKVELKQPIVEEIKEILDRD